MVRKKFFLKLATVLLDFNPVQFLDFWQWTELNFAPRIRQKNILDVNYKETMEFPTFFFLKHFNFCAF